MGRLAELRNLRVYFYDQRDKRFIRAVEDVSFSVEEGGILGVVGESGCGKTVTALSLMGLLGSEPGLIGGDFLFKPRTEDLPSLLHALERGSGEVRWHGNLLNLFHGLERFVTFESDPFTIVKDTEKWLRRLERVMLPIRGRNIGMVFQNPRQSLNPFVPVGRQLESTLCRFGKARGRREARGIARELLRSVRLRQPDVVLNMYPGSLSVGMAQRVVLAIALSSDPKLLIADEPTTGLDTTNVHAVIELIEELRRERGLAIVIISHDVEIVGRLADTIAVMYAGYVLESGSRADVLADEPEAHHPYTRTLLAAAPWEDENGAPAIPAAKGVAWDNRAQLFGCPFFERCPDSPVERCVGAIPPFVEVSPGHLVRCHLFGRDA